MANSISPNLESQKTNLAIDDRSLLKTSEISVIHDRIWPLLSGINALIVMDDIEHDAGHSRKKANSCSPLVAFGGVDGTRTRDPRRDRPVF